jgi:hypothetical protein
MDNSYPVHCDTKGKRKGLLIEANPDLCHPIGDMLGGCVLVFLILSDQSTSLNATQVEENIGHEHHFQISNNQYQISPNLLTLLCRQIKDHKLTPIQENLCIQSITFKKFIPLF